MLELQRFDDASHALGLVVVAHGGVFAGTGVDIGTRFLLGVLDDAVPDAATAVDLACGSGIVAAWLARRRPGLVVRASDRSAAAATSAALTAEANGVADRVEVTRADGLDGHLARLSRRRGDDVVYRIVSAICAHSERVRLAHPAAAAFDPAAAHRLSRGPLHPGAMRYFREAGLLPQ